MQLKGNCVFLNSESRVGTKDPTKTYFIVLLMQGTQTLECMTDEKVFHGEMSQINQYSPVACEFDFNSTYKSIRLTAIHQTK